MLALADSLTLVFPENGRARRAQAHSLTPERCRELYPRFDDFMRLRAQLDPHDLFVNSYAQRHLLGDDRAKVEQVPVRARL